MKGKNQENILSLFDNKIVFQNKGFQKELIFDDSIIICKKKEYHLCNIFQVGTYGKKYLPNYSTSILIKSSTDSSKIIKFGPIKNYLEIVEVIYLSLLSWKQTKDYLLNKEEMGKLEKTHAIYSQKQVFDEAPLSFQKNDISQEVLAQFEKYIDKDEDILSIYLPKKQILQKILFLAGVYIAGLIIYYLVLYMIPFLEFIYYFYMVFLLSVIILFLLILYLFNPPPKFIFTNKKTIIKFRKKLCFSSYNNILKSICNLNREIQEIQIYFKETLKGDCIKSENKYIELNPPRTLRIFELLRKNKYET